MPQAESLEGKARCQTVSKARDTSRGSPDLMSDIEGLHPLLGGVKAACPRWSDLV